MRFRSCIFKLTACVLLSAAAFGGTHDAKRNLHWVGTWACAPVEELPLGASAVKGGPKYASVTIRDVIHVSLGGEVVRLRISNQFGKSPVKIENVHVGLSSGQDAIQSGTNHSVTFGGESQFEIPAGQLAVSDPIALHVPPLTSLAVSLYVPRQDGISLTYHIRALSTNFYATGDQTSALVLESPRTIHTWVFLTGVDVEAPKNAAAVVAYGDSITDGLRSTPDANRRWPDDLARKFQGDPRTRERSVLNLGISGNRILYPQAGPSMVERLDRDVFGQSGVKYLILFAGINDIHHSVNRPNPNQKETAQDIIAGMKEIVERAHQHGIKVYGATITPAGGSPFHNPTSEAMRQTINHWIRTGHGFDAWFDFDRAVRDAKNPGVLAPAFDTPDHTHLNDAGYQALANSISLKKFR